MHFIRGIRAMELAGSSVVCMFAGRGLDDAGTGRQVQPHMKPVVASLARQESQECQLAPH